MLILAQVKSLDLCASKVEGVDYYVSFESCWGTSQGRIVGCVVTIPLGYDFSKDRGEDGRRFSKLREWVSAEYIRYHTFPSDREDYSAEHIRIVSWSRMEVVR